MSETRYILLHDIMVSTNLETCTLPETNMAPENEFGMAYFQGRTVSFRECILGMVIPPLIGNPYSGQINPYCWVDDPPLLYGKQLFPGYLFFLWVWELNVTKQGLFRTSGEGWMD